MSRRKDGRPRSIPGLAESFTPRLPRTTSTECLDKEHDKCDMLGGCGGCWCHTEQD